MTVYNQTVWILNVNYYLETSNFLELKALFWKLSGLM